MNNLRTYILLLIIFYSYTSYAQNISIAEKTLTWYSDQGVDKHSNQQVFAAMKIITNASTSIDLIRGSDQPLNFTIDSIEGTWVDQLTDGKLTYSVHYQSDIFGKVVIQRQGDSVHVLFDFVQGNPNALHHDFLISNVE